MNVKKLTIDELITKLVDAKEHGFLGTEEVIVRCKNDDVSYIFDVEKVNWDNKRIYIDVF